MAREKNSFVNPTINPNKQFAALRYFRRKAKRRVDTDRINRRKEGRADNEEVSYQEAVLEYYNAK